MTREQANVERMLRTRVSIPVKRGFWKLTMSIAEEIPGIMSLPKWPSEKCVRDLVWFPLAGETE